MAEPTVAQWNNNPGNLRPPKGVTYDGQVGVDDNGFAIFTEPSFGRKALIGDINIKLKRGLNTPNKFIDVYSPASDNDEKARANYKNYIASSVGIKNPNEPFPEGSAEKIADAITGFEGGTWNKPAETKKEENSTKTSPDNDREFWSDELHNREYWKDQLTGQIYEFIGTPEERARLKQSRIEENKNKAFDGTELNNDAVADAEKEHKDQNVEYTDPKSVPGVNEANKDALKVLGAKIGAGTAGAVETGKKVLPLVPNVYSQIMGLDQNINRPSTRMSMQRYLNSQINHNLNLNLSDLEKEYNALMKSKNPGAVPVKIRTMAEVQQALDAIKPTPDQMIAKPRVEQVRPGVFRETGEFTSKKVPGNPGVDMSQYEINPKTPIANEVKAGVKTAGNVVKGALPSVARVGIGALGGLGALSSGYDTVETAREKGWTDPRTISKGAATLGSTLMMYPSWPTEIFGGLLNAPELIWNGYDYIQERKNILDKKRAQKALESAPIN